MRHPRSHTHPCEFAGLGCTRHLLCDGELERNVDGEPPVICRTRDLYEGPITTWICPACLASICAACGSILRLEPHCQTCSRRVVEARA